MTTNALDMAFALLRENRPVEAHELMVREVRDVEARHGRGGPEWASAQCDLGHVLLNAGQPEGAAECYRNACAHPPADPEDHKDYLTYRLNLGMALRMAGRLDEAESELRRGAGERLAFYGEGHPGHAFGLQPLAEVSLDRGDLAQARQVVEQTVAIFWNSGHPQLADALALRAQIMGGGAFESLGQLPDDVVEQVADAVLNRQMPPDAAWPVVKDLVSALEVRLGAEHQSTLNALSMMANLGRAVGDTQGRVAAIQRVLSTYDRQGKPESALMAAQGLAIAYSEAGDHENSLRAYADALGRAERLGHPEQISQTLRNWGLALADVERHGEAEQRLREAVAQARRGADPETLGRGLVALGLFLQHRERLDEARALTEEGISRLDPAHPDAVVGRGHLNAMVRDQSCGCGDMGDAVAESFRQFVIGQLPQDLLQDFTVEVKEGDFQISVELRREPSEEELQRMDRVIQTAYAEFRRRITA